MSCASMSPGHGNKLVRAWKGLESRTLRVESCQDPFNVGGSGSIKMTSDSFAIIVIQMPKAY